MSNKIFSIIIASTGVVLLALILCLGQPKEEERFDSTITLSQVTLTPEVETPIVEEPQKETCKYENCLLCLSNVSLEELEAALKYELVPLAPYLLEAEELYGVNACYLASIAALESGWGRYQFRENNLFGFGHKSFDSPQECIYYVAEFLATNYLSEDGRYFAGGYTLSHVNKYYNGSNEWYNKVSSIYAGIMKHIEEQRNEIGE